MARDRAVRILGKGDTLREEALHRRLAALAAGTGNGTRDHAVEQLAGEFRALLDQDKSALMTLRAFNDIVGYLLEVIPGGR
ncbi:hypothetical protein [Sphaerisporangium fuscum]|uniref:hypothetical protein n=1 Tax=Sphaerisporangium fuscum TaxID=2835868 RepID=UPI002029A68B|nr:hypothetical protein [Sphaerisporangium fuscum]